MSKLFQITIVLVYILFSVTILFDTFLLFGLRFSTNVKIELTVAWTIFCFLSHWFMADFHLFRWLPVRKPILAEEQKLERLFAPVLQGSGFSKRVKLRITEEVNLNAFAIGRRTISVSRKMLRDFSDEELQGVLAHELGHLINRDSTINAAFIMARSLPFSFYCTLPIFLIKKVNKYFILQPLFIILKFIAIAFFILLFVRAWQHNHLFLFATICLWFIFFRKILKIFDFFWRAVTRFIEYKQDAYAHAIGYGNGLRQALEKLISDEGEPVNLYENMMKYDHPVIYNRIRRLEKLSGLRT